MQPDGPSWHGELTAASPARRAAEGPGDAANVCFVLPFYFGNQELELGQHCDFWSQELELGMQFVIGHHDPKNWNHFVVGHHDPKNWKLVLRAAAQLNTL